LADWNTDARLNDTNRDFNRIYEVLTNPKYDGYKDYANLRVHKDLVLQEYSNLKTRLTSNGKYVVTDTDFAYDQKHTPTYSLCGKESKVVDFFIDIFGLGYCRNSKLDMIFELTPTSRRLAEEEEEEVLYPFIDYSQTKTLTIPSGFKKGMEISDHKPVQTMLRFGLPPPKNTRISFISELCSWSLLSQIFSHSFLSF